MDLTATALLLGALSIPDFQQHPSDTERKGRLQSASVFLGIRHSTTYPFLREIMPQYAVISVGDNSYGHPTEDTLSRLRDADVKVYRTDYEYEIYPYRR